jgi:hypothetical protein
MTLLNRHRVAVLLELSRLGAASEAARVANSDALGTVLLGLYNGATTGARKAFMDRMNPVPQSQKPWAAVMPTPSSPTPAVVILLLGQRDDDPDAAEDGNRLPVRGSAAAAPWEPLYAAIDRWDLDTIARFIGPLGWRVPLADAVLKGTEVDPAPPVDPVSNPGPAPPLPPVPRPPDPPAPVPANFWRRPEVLVAGGVGAGLLVAALFHSLMRPSAPEVRA